MKKLILTLVATTAIIIAIVAIVNTKASSNYRMDNRAGITMQMNTGMHDHSAHNGSGTMTPSAGMQNKNMRMNNTKN